MTHPIQSYPPTWTSQTIIENLTFKFRHLSPPRYPYVRGSGVDQFFENCLKIQQLAYFCLFCIMLFIQREGKNKFTLEQFSCYTTSCCMIFFSTKCWYKDCFPIFYKLTISLYNQFCFCVSFTTLSGNLSARLGQKSLIRKMFVRKCLHRISFYAPGTL